MTMTHLPDLFSVLRVSMESLAPDGNSGATEAAAREAKSYGFSPQESGTIQAGAPSAQSSSMSMRSTTMRSS